MEPRTGGKIVFLLSLFLLSLGLYLKVSGNSPAGPTKSSSKDEPSQGSVYGTSLGLPSNFPLNFTLYPKSLLTSSSSNENSGVVTLSASGQLSEISNFYSESLLKNGWQKKDENTYQKSGTILELTFAENEGNQAIVVLSYSLVPTK